jgi:hypothetical protein
VLKVFSAFFAPIMGRTHDIGAFLFQQKFLSVQKLAIEAFYHTDRVKWSHEHPRGKFAIGLGGALFPFVIVCAQMYAFVLLCPTLW